MRVLMKTDLGTSKQSRHFKGSVSEANSAPALHLRKVMKRFFYAGDGLKERLGGRGDYQKLYSEIVEQMTGLYYFQ